MNIDETGFMIRCGQCKHWTPLPDMPGIGQCPILKQNRHDRRELCKDEWDREAFRIGRLAGEVKKRSDMQWEVLDRRVDPLRAWIIFLNDPDPMARFQKKQKAQKEPVRSKKE